MFCIWKTIYSLYLFYIKCILIKYENKSIKKLFSLIFGPLLDVYNFFLYFYTIQYIIEKDAFLIFM